jgi:voltage-gated potassium channel
MPGFAAGSSCDPASMVITDSEEQTPAFRAWTRSMEWPLMGVAVLFGVTYAFQVLAEPQGAVLVASQLVNLGCWLVFAVDYVVRLRLATNRRRWFFRNLLSLLVVVLPMLRPLRLVRLLTLFPVFQRAAGTALRGRVVTYAAATTTLLVLVASLAVFDAERYAPGADIITYGDALWWACVTITTVGYGDLYPVTVEGRCIAIAMMVCGIALLGTVTATIASWLVERVAAEEQAGQSATAAHVQGLADKIDRLETLLVASMGGRRAQPPVEPVDQPPWPSIAGETVT